MMEISISNFFYIWREFLGQVTVKVWVKLRSWVSSLSFPIESDATRTFYQDWNGIKLNLTLLVKANNFDEINQVNDLIIIVKERNCTSETKIPPTGREVVIEILKLAIINSFAYWSRVLERALLMTLSYDRWYSSIDF